MGGIYAEQGVDKNLARVALTCVASEIPSTDMDNWWLRLGKVFVLHVAVEPVA